MLKLGCSCAELKVPLMVELYGYGPYAGRRNRGTFSPLYCRCFSFNDGRNRAVIIYSDITSSNLQYSREIRAHIASKFSLDPACIALVATHTHSAPALAAESTDTSGIRNAGFQQYWKNTVLELAERAMFAEEEISSADCGRASLEEPVGMNRVCPQKNITDPHIRWMRFKRADGSVKLLIHNHGVHGTSDNGANYKYVSADWMGFANRYILENKLAENVLYLNGPAGDINPCTSSLEMNSNEASSLLAKRYVGYLAEDLSNGVPLNTEKVSGILKTFEFPCVRRTSEELREDSAAFTGRGDYWAVNAARLEEMALLQEQGYNLVPYNDLQIISVGDAKFFFIPGEYYIEPGIKLLNTASGVPFAATHSNGDGGYFFTAESSARYPAPVFDDSELFGYYEIYGYMHRLKFKYQDNIAEFIMDKFKIMEEELNEQTCN